MTYICLALFMDIKPVPLRSDHWGISFVCSIYLFESCSTLNNGIKERPAFNLVRYCLEICHIRICSEVIRRSQEWSSKETRKETEVPIPLWPQKKIQKSKLYILRLVYTGDFLCNFCRTIFVARNLHFQIAFVNGRRFQFDALRGFHLRHIQKH